MNMESENRIEAEMKEMLDGDLDACPSSPLTSATALNSAGAATPAELGVAAPAGSGPVAPPPTAEQIEQWRAKAAKADEHWDRLLRQAAELENYKKRAARERQEAIKFANESLLKKLISVLDNLEMALAAANNAQANTVESLRTGVTMIGNQLRNILAEAGLEEIDATHQPFDPNWHEAVSQQESTEAPPGQVIQQLRKGYRMRERLLRPASVVVAKSPTAQSL